MPLTSIALAAAVAGVLATAPAAPTASAQAANGGWPPGNCPQGTFCIWPNWDHPAEGPTATPSLVTSSEWSGNVTAFNYYNHTSRNAEITWSYNYLGTIHTGAECVRPGGGNFYVPLIVTKVTWQPRTC
ncbi:hypothetical protein [Micromonospora chokoriensis]|uniref:Peptidase inhibitor family I36 n=1 Tax=Micromonospora chokoriensis TaxID=356851 RepID=A0A1C4Z3W1_9ACTN|nr:hypothetical protein [Micromonospora chokoriensis]SCF27577.1 hypothetical protein GA0070612_5732 [Micromonospora chokoriensis]